MKIVDAKRFVRSILIVLGIITILSLMLMNTTLSHKEIEYKIIYVSEGDTLWNIAAELQNSNYYKGKDIRYIIEDIVKINNLDSKSLMANQKLEIPII